MPQKNCSIFKSYFLRLAKKVISKLPLLPNIFTESKIAAYHDNNSESKDLNFQVV